MCVYRYRRQESERECAGVRVSEGEIDRVCVEESECRGVSGEKGGESVEGRVRVRERECRGESRENEREIARGRLCVEERARVRVSVCR